MKYCVAFFVCICMAFAGNAQLYVGAGFGTFNVRGGSDKLKGTGPNLLISYIGENERAEWLLDLALYSKKNEDHTSIYDQYDQYVGTALRTKSYNVKHIQLGAKASLVGDFDTRVNWFMGGGVAFSFVKATINYNLPGYAVPTDNVNNTLYGFHYNTGIQWRIKKLVVELRGNFDFMLKPYEVLEGDNQSYFLSSTRVGILYPIPGTF